MSVASLQLSSTHLEPLSKPPSKQYFKIDEILQEDKTIVKDPILRQQALSNLEKEGNALIMQTLVPSDYKGKRDACIHFTQAGDCYLLINEGVKTYKEKLDDELRSCAKRTRSSLRTGQWWTPCPTPKESGKAAKKMDEALVQENATRVNLVIEKPSSPGEPVQIKKIDICG